MGLKYVFGQDALVADFLVRSKLAYGFTEWRGGFGDKKLRAIGVVNDDDELIAGIVYFNWHPEAGTIEMSVEALPKQRWLTPTTIGVFLRYPFLRCKCQMLTTKISDRSAHIKRMLAAGNFSFIRLPRAGGRNEDAIYAYLTYEAWLESKFCRRYGHHLIDDAQGRAA